MGRLTRGELEVDLAIPGPFPLENEHRTVVLALNNDAPTTAATDAVRARREQM